MFDENILNSNSNFELTSCELRRAYSFYHQKKCFQINLSLLKKLKRPKNESKKWLQEFDPKIARFKDS